MKKIAFITSSLANGGAERNIINLSLKLPHTAYKTHIISLTNTNAYKDEYGNKIEKLHITTILRQKTRLYTVQKIILAPIVAFKLIKLLKKRGYDVLIASHEYNTFYLTVLCSKILGCKSILIVGNNLYEDLEDKFVLMRLYHKFCLSISFRLTNSIISVSRGLKKQLINTFEVNSRKIDLIYNGVDLDFIQKSIKKNITSKPKVFKIIAIGRLIERKGHHHLIKILKYLRKNKKLNVELTIIGTGELHSKLIDTAKKYKIDSCVTVLPNGGRHLYSTIANSSVFILSSYYEGFGNVLVEAMNCGLPVIAVNCKFGPAEILEDGKYGILTPKLQKDSLQNTSLSYSERKIAIEVENLINDKSRYCKFHNLSLERGRIFSLSSMIAGYDNVIRSVLS